MPAAETASDLPRNSSSLTRTRPGCATQPSSAGASATAAPSPSGGHSWTPIGGLDGGTGSRAVTSRSGVSAVSSAERMASTSRPSDKRSRRRIRRDVQHPKVRLISPRQLRRSLACTNIIENGHGAQGLPQRQILALALDGPAMGRPRRRRRQDFQSPQPGRRPDGSPAPPRWSGDRYCVPPG